MKIAVVLLLTSAAASAADWLTDGYDSKRTAWQRNETILSPSTVKDMKLLWKIKLDNEVKQMHALFPPLIVERVTTPSGTKQLAIATGVDDNLFAIDVESGKVLWKKHFDSNWTPPTGGRGAGIL